MPPSHEILTDDYVAGLLVREATDCSLKYSSMGLDAFRSDKRPANQPKPNTRFLNNIIRDTNSHNRALLAKENAESQARLRDLEAADRQNRDDEARRERRSKPGPSDTRKRMLGDITAILTGPSKKRRPNEGASKATTVTRDEDASTSRKDNSRDKIARRNGNQEDSTRSKSRSRRDDQYSDSHNGDRHKRHREERRHSHKSGSHEWDDRHRKHTESSSREKDDRKRHCSTDKARTREQVSSANKSDDSDSDPLDDIIGPVPLSKPAVRRRGRGLNASMSGIDSRFAPDYDPTVDVTPDPEETANDDWDNKVEAFRDRQKWRQQGAERLRSAGFTEDQIRKWEKGDKKDESDVQWNKAGGVREWDRGKFDETNGTVLEESDFGRLKDR
ncbi:hypothetical protein GGR50DRAFT_515258 [Xylaria sp. CBS 124048]|nr:hypothetical protein GGR50DRAFT_515258 [Xylaria sp. CBS 124048]